MNSIPVVTKNILIINVLCFFGSVVAAKYGIDLNDLLGLHFFLASDFNPAQLITYMFMHAGFQHIFFNMFAVWMFGRTLEQVWGSKRFLFYYISVQVWYRRECNIFSMSPNWSIMRGLIRELP
mgnify:CR=1 FL=1